MKQGKLSILLAAVLCLTMLVTACTDAGVANDSETTLDASSDGAATTVDGDTQNSEAEQETLPEEVWHEVHDWFVLVDKDAPQNLTDISRIEGEVVSQDLDHNLVVIRDQDLDRYNNVITKLTVYNILTNETLIEAEASSPLYCQVEEDEVNLSVTINYPVIRVLKSYYVDDEPVYDADFYLAKAGEGNCIYSIEQADANLIPKTFILNDLANGLVKATLGDKVMWIDGGMNIIRTIPTITENGYAADFDGEYQGCLYTLNENMVRVFNRQGLCSAEYVLKDVVNSSLSSFILDNGNVLIHEYTSVKDYEAYDFAIDGDRFTVKSFVLDFDEGTLTEVDLGFVVADLQTAYGDTENYRFDMKLARGLDNQAFIYRYTNGSINTYPEYVVLSNDLEVQYTLKNATLGVDMTTLYVIDNHHYAAYVDAGVGAGYYIFDLDGNIVAYNVNDYLSGGYQIVDNGYFYNGAGELVFDAYTEGYMVIGAYGHMITVAKRSATTGSYETFLMDLRTKKLVQLSDGIETALSDLGNGYYTVRDINTGVFTVYTMDGAALLVSAEGCAVTIYDDIYLIQTTFDGEDILYVVKEATTNAN